MVLTTPEDWMKTIHKEADNALKNRISRFSVEWGRWSAIMNSHIRKRIEDKDPETPKLKIVFLYWVLMSQCIEMAHKKSKDMNIDENRFSDTVTILEKIKNMITEGIWPSFSPDEITMIVRGEKGAI